MVPEGARDGGGFMDQGDIGGGGGACRGTPGDTATATKAAGFEFGGRYASPGQTSSSSSRDDSPGPTGEAISLRLRVLDGAGGERQLEVRCVGGAAVRDLVNQVFASEISQGWSPLCFYWGRPLAPTEQLSRVPANSLVQVYMKRVEAPVPEDQGNLNEWARLTGVPLAPMPRFSKDQDMLFHGVLALAFSLAWGARFADVLPLDHFGRFALHFFSALWAVVCLLDFTWRPQAEAAAEAAAATPNGAQAITTAAATTSTTADRSGSASGGEAG